MSNLGFSLDRNFSASDVTRQGRRPPASAAALRRRERWNFAPLAGLALAASIFGALAAKWLF